MISLNPAPREFIHVCVGWGWGEPLGLGVKQCKATINSACRTFMQRVSSNYGHNPYNYQPLGDAIKTFKAELNIYQAICVYYPRTLAGLPTPSSFSQR